LAQAFETLGNEEKRKQYDSMTERDSVQAAFEKIFEDLRQKMQEAQNLMQCPQCGGKHKRYLISDRSMYSARFCGMCCIMHPVNEGDVWCESRMFGFKLFFYACMDGDIWDITEWAACQGLWNRVRANAHAVTLKISTPGNQRNKPRSQQQYDESVYCIKYRLHAAKQSHLYIFDLKVQDLNPCIRK
jgi:DnaJ family protein C protein 14